MVFLEFQSTVDAGMARRVAVSADGEVLSSLSEPYAALDARRHRREHLPRRNLVSTLFELNGIEAVGDAAAPLSVLGTWLPGLGVLLEPVRAAYAEWLATTMPTLFPGDDVAALVERFTLPTFEEETMAVTVLEERLQRRLRRERRDSEAVGVQRGREQGARDTRDLLASQAARKFGPGSAARAVDLLAEIGDTEGLRRAGEWIIDCATVEELVERLENGQNRRP